MPLIENWILWIKISCKRGQKLKVLLLHIQMINTFNFSTYSKMGFKWTCIQSSDFVIYIFLYPTQLQSCTHVNDQIYHSNSKFRVPKNLTHITTTLRIKICSILCILSILCVCLCTCIHIIIHFMLFWGWKTISK